MFRQGLEIILDKQLAHKEKPTMDAHAPLPQPAATVPPFGSELVEKLSAVKGEVESKLKDGEMLSREFDSYLFDRLKSKGIVNGKYDAPGNRAYSKAADEIGYEMARKLQIQHESGVVGRYRCLPDVKLSAEAAHDVALAEEVKRNAKEYFVSKYGKTPVVDDVLGKEVDAYAENHPLVKLYGKPRFMFDSDVYCFIARDLNVIKHVPEPVEAVPGLKDALKKL